MKKLLFVCSANMDRSPVAESLFKDSEEYEAKSCGTHPFAEKSVTKEILEWADMVFCMEHEHKQFILDNFDTDVNKIVVLGVGNEYTFGDARLEGVLGDRLRDWVEVG